MYLRAHEVAARAGVSKNTLLRWLKAGKVPEVRRDRNGWRVFSEDDLGRVLAYARGTLSPDEYAALRRRPAAEARQRVKQQDRTPSEGEPASSPCPDGGRPRGDDEEAA